MVVQILDDERLFLVHCEQDLFDCRVARRSMSMVRRRLGEVDSPSEQDAWNILCQTGSA